MKAIANNIFLIFFLIFSINDIFCQIEDSTKTYETGNYKLRFDRYHKYKSPLLSLSSAVYNYDYNQFIFPTLNQNVLNENLSRLRLRENINSAMVIYKQGLMKNDLGIVGDILGYTNAAAAIGLAIYHVSKYKKHYRIK